MRFQGKISDWNDDKGYGFVEPNGGGTRAFVHIKSFTDLPRRPISGDIIIYETTNDEKNRVQAINISFTRIKKKQTTQQINEIGSFNKFIIMAFITYLLALIFIYNLPVIVLFGFMILSIITFAAYALDKNAAQNGNWRTKESTLHILALIGGWPGAMYAQQKLRHKSIKTEFRQVFWATVVMNIAAISWIALSETGRSVITQLTHSY
jgi:Predicted membrane protein